MGVPQAQPQARDKVEGAREIPSHQVARGIRMLDDAATRAAEMLRDSPDLREMMELKSEAPPESQIEGITVLESHLINVLTRIAQRAEGKLKGVKPGHLMQDAELRGVQVAPEESLAWQKYMELTSRPGATSQYLIKAWAGPEGKGGLLQQAEYASLGLGGKAKKFLKENPVTQFVKDHPANAAIYIAGAVGIGYLGYRFIKWLTRDEETAKKGEPKKKSWRLLPDRKIVLALGVIAATMAMNVTDRKGALRELLMKMAPKEIRDLMAKSDALPEKVRRELREAKSDVEAARGNAVKAVEGARDRLAEVSDEAREVLTNEEIQREASRQAVTDGLVALYALDHKKFPGKLRRNISMALTYLSATSLQKIISAHEEYRREGKIAPETFGITDFSEPEALFHACALMTKARDYYLKHYPGVAVDDLPLNNFLDHLAKDPSHSIHGALARQLETLDLSSLTDVPKKIAQAFDPQAIEAFFSQNLQPYLTNLAQKYGVEIPLEEKGQFFTILGLMYKDGNLNWSEGTLSTKLDSYHASPAVKTAILKLYLGIQKEARENLKHVVERYDIKRTEPGMEDYNEVLRETLLRRSDELSFADGVQLALVMQGLNLGEGSGGGDFDQSKDVAMIMVLARILKHIDPGAYSRYLGNIGVVIAGNVKALHLNLPWQKLQPYLKFMVTQVTERVKEEVQHKTETWLAFGRMSNQPGFIEHMRTADAFQFATAAGQEVMGSFPRDVILNLRENLGDVFDETTDASMIVKMILAASGSLLYTTTEKGEQVGVIWLLGKYYFWYPGKAVVDTLRASAESAGAMVKTYLVETAPYVVIGGLAGAWNARGVKTGIGILNGMVRGLGAPITAPIAGYRAVRSVIWETERARRIAGAALNTTGHMLLTQKSTDLFLRYWGRIHGTSGSRLDKLEALAHETGRQGKMSIYQDVYQAYARHWGNYFIRDYYHFFGINPMEEGGLSFIRIGGLRSKSIPLSGGPFEELKLASNESELNAAVKIAKRMNKVMEELKKIPDLENLDDPKRFIQELNRIASMEFGEEKLLRPYELESLVHQANDTKAFGRLRRMILAAKQEGVTGKAARSLGALRQKVGARGRAWLQEQKWYQGFERWRGAKFNGADLATLAKIKDPDQAAAFLRVKRVPPELAERIAREIALTDDVAAIQRTIGQVAESGSVTVKFAPEVSRWARFGVLAGKLATGAGVALNGILAYQAFSEAASTSNAERRRIQAAKGSLYVANVPADIGLYVLGAAGAGSALAAGVGAAGLAAVTYMGASGLESKYEATKSVAEWAATDHRQLIHDWISTHSWGAGEAYRLFANQKEIGHEKKEIVRRIAAAIICQEDQSQAPSPDRMYYLEVTCHLRPPANYHEALEFLRDSRIYANLMQQRRMKGGLIDEKPSAAKIQTMMQEAKVDVLSRLTPDLKNNFDHFSDRYLVDLCCKSFALLHGEDQEVSDNEIAFTDQLEIYLTLVRGIDMSREYVTWLAEKRQKGELNADSMVKVQKEWHDGIAQMQKDPGRALREDLEHRTDNQAVYALTELARFFGYTGYPNEESLKKFFDEAHGGAYGLYWDGGEWVVNEAGLESDNEIGETLDEKTIRQIIATLREDPDNVIENRQDALVDIGGSPHSFRKQVEQMARVLEKGLQKTRSTRPVKPTSAPPLHVAEAILEDEGELRRAA